MNRTKVKLKMLRLMNCKLNSSHENVIQPLKDGKAPDM
jgi:hypothetical protein